MRISFEKATLQHKKLAFGWLDKPHVQEFWDNSDAYRLDLDIFMNGREIQSPYFDGIFDYWIGSSNGEPFCLMMSNQVSVDDDVPDLWKANLSRTGHTTSLDFMIGEESLLGKGLAALAISEFIVFYHSKIDAKTDLFLIDPDKNNQKALRAYKNAGFIRAGEFMAISGVFEGYETILMTKKV
jgi:RimJ/RimL family protein N-acetyltransferase